ncbi:GAF domain-containing protein [Plantactinospora sp. GCM10030261]|uniref:GAF domain-containing protein n=1 Tax=Plantactinospora sp. GCM10030261 TaxID=3273420 RepID=UPI0036077A4F
MSQAFEGAPDHAANGAVDSGRAPQLRVRDVVAASWRRSLGARLDPDTTAPIELTDDSLAAYRADHPLARVLPLVRDLLGGVTQDGAHLMAVCDAAGRLLWVEGHPAVRRQAERMNFVPGARWDEGHAGTNAPGTALAEDHSVQIFATEHFSRPVQRWTCAAAPIHDPATGRLLGALDITGGDHLANPQSLALVRATARAAEAYLATIRPPAGNWPSPVTGTGWLGSADTGPEGPTGMGAGGLVRALGRDTALLSTGGRRIRLGRRHSELVVLLLSHPEGRTGEQLGLDLYGDGRWTPVTLRAELSRLRRNLGPALLDSRPYRLRPGLDADFLAVTRLLDAGRVATAVEAYRGPLLPASDAPEVGRLRRLVDGQLRAAVLAGADPAALAAWARAPWGETDLRVWERLVAVLPLGSPHRPLAADRVRQLRMEYGLPADPGRQWPPRRPQRVVATDATWLQRPRH